MRIRVFALLTFVSALGLLPAACSPPPPYEPGNDCPKEPNCGQCTSRGGCGWCGDKCLAIGAPSCASAWAKSPDMCAEPAATNP